jgi:hypothetical protein
METTSNSDHDLWMTKILNAVRSVRLETLRKGRSLRPESHDANCTASVLKGTVLAPRADAR